MAQMRHRVPDESVSLLLVALLPGASWPEDDGMSDHHGTVTAAADGRTEA